MAVKALMISFSSSTAQVAQQLQIPVALQGRMKPADHVNLRDAVLQRFAHSLDDLRDRQLKGVGLALLGSEGAELTGKKADIRIVDVAVVNIGRHVPVLPFPHDVGDRTDTVDIGAFVKSDRVLTRKCEVRSRPFAGLAPALSRSNENS